MSNLPKPDQRRMTQHGSFRRIVTSSDRIPTLKSNATIRHWGKEQTLISWSSWDCVLTYSINKLCSTQLMKDCLGDETSQFISMINYSRNSRVQATQSSHLSFDAVTQRVNQDGEREAKGILEGKIRYHFRLMPFDARSFFYWREEKVLYFSWLFVDRRRRHEYYVWRSATNQHVCTEKCETSRTERRNWREKGLKWSKIPV